MAGTVLAFLPLIWIAWLFLRLPISLMTILYCCIPLLVIALGVYVIEAKKPNKVMERHSTGLMQLAQQAVHAASVSLQSA